MAHNEILGLGDSILSDGLEASRDREPSFTALLDPDYIFDENLSNGLQYPTPCDPSYSSQTYGGHGVDTFASFPYADLQQPSRSTPTLLNTSASHRSLDNLSLINPKARSSRRNRSLPRKKSQYFVQRTERQSIPIPYSGFREQNGLDNDFTGQPDPLQRWRDSPPESEPASMFAIRRALSDEPARTSTFATQASRGSIPEPSAVTLSNSFSGYRPTSSAASSDSGASESSQKTTASERSRNRSRLKVRRTAKAKDEKEQRRFKCTFCCDDFRTKYDWTRHEKSLHLDLEEWRCAPEGSMVFSPVTGRIHCAYCNILDPTCEHLEIHNYEVCDNPAQPTKFHRKDHLVQHLRLVHQMKSLPLIDDWKVDSGPISCRCGFCGSRILSWDERVSHLSEHFRKGLTMVDWRGDHDFDVATAAKVRSAIPPYCIGYESRALVPFMAADLGTQDHFNQISSSISGMNLHTNEESIEKTNANVPTSNARNLDDQVQLSSNPGVYTDMLARHLGRFARDQIVLGIVPTDEMFQREARRVIYDCESDGWNQTVADNEDWLTSFKGQLNDLT